MKRAGLSTQWVLLCGVLFLFTLSACNFPRTGVQIGGKPSHKGGPPPHAPAHGYRAKHNYHYYPTTQIYFDLSRKVYFYLEGGSWRMTVSLPDSLRVELGDSVTIAMDTDRPYTHHSEHKKKYPPGQLKKKNKGNKGHKGKKGKKW